MLRPNRRRRQRKISVSILYDRQLNSTDSNSNNSEKSTKTTAHQLAHQLAPPNGNNTPTQSTNNIKTLHTVAHESIYEGKMFRALSKQERDTLLSTGKLTFNLRKNVPATLDEVVQRSTEQIENGSNYDRKAKKQAPVSFAKPASLLNLLHLAQSYSNKHGSEKGPGFMIISTTAGPASNATSASIDTSKLTLNLTRQGSAAASNLNEIHLYGQRTVTHQNIIWQDGDYKGQGLQLATPMYPVEDAKWRAELKKHGPAMMKEVRVQTTGTVNRVRIDAALSQLSEVLGDGAPRAHQRRAYIHNTTTVLITSQTSHAALSKKTKEAETIRKDVFVISEEGFVTEVQKFVKEARKASGSPDYKKRKKKEIKKNKTENNGATTCKRCEKLALPSNYGYCLKHRNKPSSSSRRKTSSSSSSKTSSSTSSGGGTTVAQLKRVEMLSFSAKYYGDPPSTEEAWEPWLEGCEEKRNKKSIEPWLNSKEGKDAIKNYENVVKQHGWNVPSGAVYLRLMGQCPVPLVEDEGGEMRVETFQARKGRRASQQVGADGLSKSLRDSQRVGADGLSKSLRDSQRVGTDGLSKSLRDNQRVGTDGLSKGLRDSQRVGTDGLSKNLRDNRERAATRREQKTVAAAQATTGVSINPHFSDKDLKPHVQTCLAEMAQIKDEKGVSMIDRNFTGFMYIFGTTDARRDIEWYSTLANKPLLWVYKNGTWNRADSDDIKAVFGHFYLSFSDRNLLNTDAIERLLQTHLKNHPHKLWEGEGCGILGNAEERDRSGTWLVGVTYTRKALPSNWSISKQKPMANTQQPAY